MGLVDGVYVVSTMAYDWDNRATLRTLDDIGVFTKENIYRKRLVIQSDMPNMARQFLMERLNTQCIWGNTPAMKRTSFNVALNHYYTLCAAKCRGHDRILLLEDDCALHRDLAGISQMLDDVPQDMDFANLFAARPGNNVGVPPQYRGSHELKRKMMWDQLHANNGNAHFKELTYTCRCANCVMMSAKFMDSLLKIWEGWFRGGKMIANDNYWRRELFPDMRMYISTVPLFVQKWTSVDRPMSPSQVYEDRLAMYGLKKEDIL